ncbi:hypothetical protein [Natronosalvus halobius]|uniref:hypothetical protein n=1 Tax=Natronosalvus halobius TaxID=2953746 RepID=UPI00209D8413|nr:hypothetical protein [Natronosalvus halobius]USZ71525.1 hypothetical protein NGM15_15905 [Natronosalvus halobius]
MVSDRELVDKWRTYVFRPAADEVRALLEQFPDRRSLTVPFDRCGTDYRFSAPLLEQPDRTLEAGRAALGEFAEELGAREGRIYPDDRVYLRVTGAPTSVRHSLSDLGTEHLNRLVTVEGTVADVDAPGPRVAVAGFRCDHCEELVSVRQPGRFLRRPGRCHHCNANGPFTLEPDRATCVDAQTIAISDDHRTLAVELEHDLVDAFSIGEEVELVAIPRARLDGETTTGTLELEAVSADPGNENPVPAP